MKKNGFTLLEVLVSISILFCLSAAAALLFSRAGSSFERASSFENGTNALLGAMEVVRSMPFNDIASRSDVPISGCIVKTRAISGALIEITAEYTGKNGRRSCLTTMRSRY